MVLFCLLVIMAVAMFFLYRQKLFTNKKEFSACLGILALLLALRWLCMAHITLDYTDFLAKWVEFFRTRGGFSALKYSIGNYNVPYLYFLALISYIPAPDLYLIKLVSIVFDMILAFAGLKLVSLFTKSRIKKLLCFFLILLLPTVILNGSLWGQCDSIYAALALWSLYFIMKDRPILSMVMIALSFGFKMQAVFIMPVFFVFLYRKKLRIRHLFVFPLTYVVLVLPAVIAGRPFLETITLYFDQMGTVGSALNYNSPSVFAFLYNFADKASAAKYGIIAAFIFVLAIFALTFIKRKQLTNDTYLTTALIFCVGIPFFLPHMHDRYFFMADVLSVCFAVIHPKRSFLPFLVSFGSLLGYHAYLKMRYLLPMSYGAAALLFVLFVLLIDLVFTAEKS
ncbi:MAG: conjugal transfer protein TraL [Clostridiales bacterium]|nr:conjugal transfer protein TraL [Clostridiales bacterium]